MGGKCLEKCVFWGENDAPAKSDHQVKSQKCLEKCVKVGGGRCPSKSDHQVKSQKLHLNSLSVWEENAWKSMYSGGKMMPQQK